MLPQMVWRQEIPPESRMLWKLNKNCAFQGKIEENMSEIGGFLRFFDKKMVKNLQVSNIYLKFATDFVWKRDN